MPRASEVQIGVRLQRL